MAEDRGGVRHGPVRMAVARHQPGAAARELRRQHGAAGRELRRQPGAVAREPRRG